jgi:hypothetical protein
MPTALAALFDFGGTSGRALAALESRCPDLVPADGWQEATADGKAFITCWGNHAEVLGWSPRDLFERHKPPAKPHPSYSRRSRYDETGLVWLLQGRGVVALTNGTAAIENATGDNTIYRRFNKPAFGPLGDSLEDLHAPHPGTPEAIRWQSGGPFDSGRDV